MVDKLGGGVRWYRDDELVVNGVIKGMVRIEQERWSGQRVVGFEIRGDLVS